MQLSLISALSIMAASLSLPAHAMPAQAPAHATCQSIGSCVSALRSYSSAASLCSSWLTLTPQTTTKTITSGNSVFTTKVTTTTGISVITAIPVIRGDGTRTVTATTITDTISASPFTVEGITSTITETPSTATVTNTVSTTICGNGGIDKRSTLNGKAPKVVPSPLKKFDQSKILAGCSCLSLTVRTSTVFKTVKGSKTTSQLVKTAAKTTVTPTLTITAETTISRIETITVTPTTTSIPSTTVTTIATTTVEEIKTIIIGPQAGTPTVVLASPTPITSVDSAGLATQDLDDSPTYPLTLPFELELYGVRSSSISVSINGWVSVQNSDLRSFVNSPLPAAALPDTAFSPYWYDLFIYRGTPQGLYYEVAGEMGARTVAIEWYTSLYQNPVGYTHFIAKFFEAEPGKAVYTYYQTTTERSTTNGQVYGTVGAQSRTGGQFAQYSYDVVPSPGLEIELNTATDSFERTNVETCSV